MKKEKKFSMTKLFMFFLFINCTVIEIFTGWVTVKNLYLAEVHNIAIDFTPLVTLIGVVLGEVLSFGIYALKSMKENTQGGIVYDQAMSAQEAPIEEEEIAVG
jgi:hypothetical protein